MSHTSEAHLRLAESLFGILDNGAISFTEEVHFTNRLQCEHLQHDIVTRLTRTACVCSTLYHPFLRCNSDGRVLAIWQFPSGQL